MSNKQNVAQIVDVLRSWWFILAFAFGVVYWVAKQDSALTDIKKSESRISNLESRMAGLESGFAQLQQKLDGMKEDLVLIKSAILK
jgi:uncharacterized protein YoxC